MHLYINLMVKKCLGGLLALGHFHTIKSALFEKKFGHLCSSLNLAKRVSFLLHLSGLQVCLSA